MCLMCEYYFESCSEPECVEAVKDSGTEEYYRGLTGTELFLFKGYSEPCVHMYQGHGPECDMLVKHETKYGLLYEECNCEEDYNNPGNWTYY